MKTLSHSQEKKVVKEIKMILHAGRDCLRNQGKDTRIIQFSVFDPYYCEAFGILRGLVLFGYGYFGSDNLSAVEERKSTNPKHNVKWWFGKIKDEVLEEEGYGTDNVCEHCTKLYYKDSRICATWRKGE
jgi:hypothetical protein